jgi:hypothetical protein
VRMWWVLAGEVLQHTVPAGGLEAAQEDLQACTAARAAAAAAAAGVAPGISSMPSALSACYIMANAARHR